MLDNVSIRQLETTDWQRVRAIYLQGIATGHATFETTAPTWEAWDAAHLEFARIVASGDAAFARSAGAIGLED